MAWLHTWSGLVIGWLLLAIFISGSASYFRQEITRWMEPELHAGGPYPAAASRAVARLDSIAPNASRWLIDLPDERDPRLEIAWRGLGEKPKFERETLDAGTGEPLATLARATRGGEFFYRFHFELSMPRPWGRWTVGAAAMCMLIALISGVITHRRIFKDFFTFRPKKGQRSWLDAHNAFGVLALPFHLMITYTGLVTLMFMYMPWGITTAYQGDRDAFFAEADGMTETREASGSPAVMSAIEPMLAQARQHWQGGRLGRLTIDHPNDTNATLTIARHDGDSISHHGEELRFNAISGVLLTDNHVDGPARATHGVLYGLHIARFADPLLRWLFFLSGLAGAAMVATGLLLWSVARIPRRADTRPGFGQSLVNVLNIAAVAGMPLAVASYFWANRLLPAQLDGRDDLEVKVVFLTWLASLTYALLRAGLGAAQRAWKEVMGLAALLFAGIPLLNACTSSQHLPGTLLQGQWALAGFDLTALALSALLGYTAWKLGRWQPVRRTRPAAGKPPRAARPDEPVSALPEGQA